MNPLPHTINISDQTQFFLRDKQAWENAIAIYNGVDPLELWYNYICWYDYNIHIDPENKFRETLEKCLALFEHIECYKQDIRIVKLWVKYIDLQPNPLNLYQLLYQRGIGTQSSCFYISWAHYYDSASAFKQAESVYNLGFQAKAEPFTELQDAHTKFRLSVSQRMLYNDSSSKKRSANNLNEQRQQITTLTPPPVKKNRNEIKDSQSVHQENLNNSLNSNHNSSYENEYTFPTNPCGTDNSRPDSEPYTNLKNSAYVITSSLNYIYSENQTALDDTISTEENILGNVKIGPNFARYSRNNYEMWKPLLFLEEPYDENKRCMYQKHLIYPGDENEYSPEEIRAKKWTNNRKEMHNNFEYNHGKETNVSQSSEVDYQTENKDFYMGDFEEQIEASTIRFSMDTDGETKNKTIKIKFRRDVNPNPTANYVVNVEDLNLQNYDERTKQYHEKTGKSCKNANYATAKQKGKKIKKIKIINNYDDPKYTKKDLKISSDYKNQSFKNIPKDANKTLTKNEFEDASLLLSFANVNSNDGLNFTVNEKNLQQNESFSFNDETNAEFNSTFDNSSYLTSLHKSTQSCSTPQSFKKYTSNTSVQNDDSLCAYEQNSFFASEHDEDLKKKRLEMALNTIEIHLNKPIIDPFSSELCKAFLTKLDVPSRDIDASYNVVNNPIQKLSNTKTINLADINYNIEKEVGKGSYGSVYKAINTNSGNVVALKFQRPANTWELYICMEVRKRIKDPYIFSGFMDISSATIAPNASIFVTEFSSYGSLLDVNNKLRQATKKVMHESLVIHFSVQILSIIHHLHSCKIIHADIKPDNFLLMRIPNLDSHMPSLRLIDFGCAIDMTLFSEDTQFKKVIQTDGFTCIEMQEGRPWSYQTDLFCVAGTVHVMLFGEYMQIVKKFDIWDIKQKLPRYLKKHVWSEFFSKMLNISDIHNLPNLNQIKRVLDEECIKMESELQTNIRTLSNILHRR